MPVNFYEVVWIVLIYAFLGWCTEVAYAAVCDGKFVNRGFLNGPVCPIYGFGMLLVVTILWNLRSNIVLLFLGSVIFTTLLEFVTGYVLEKLFHEKWWDYSDIPFNIKGYVCLKFSIAWGLAASFVIGAVHPFIYFIIEKVPFKIGIIFLVILSAAFLSDFIITLVEILKIPKKLNAIIELEKFLSSVSDGIGENISDKAIVIKENTEEFVEEKKPQYEEKKAQFEEKTAELKAEIERKKAEYQRLTANKNIVHKRILKAFPNLKEGKYKAVFERAAAQRAAFQEKIHEKKK